ncbi:MAG: PH domain-containing protein [Leeuwenhoekiella sp.]
MLAFTNEEIDINQLPDFATVGYNDISPKYLSKSLIGLGVLTLIFLGGWGFLWMTEIPVLGLWFLLLALLIFFGVLLFNTVQRQKCYGYALRERDIVFKRGFLVSKVTVIPFNRIQHIETSSGVLDKAFKLSNLDIFTAGGSGSDITIPGLDPDTALRLKETIRLKMVAVHE